MILHPQPERIRRIVSELASAHRDAAGVCGDACYICAVALMMLFDFSDLGPGKESEVSLRREMAVDGMIATIIGVVNDNGYGLKERYSMDDLNQKAAAINATSEA